MLSVAILLALVVVASVAYVMLQSNPKVSSHTRYPGEYISVNGATLSTTENSVINNNGAIVDAELPDAAHDNTYKVITRTHGMHGGNLVRVRTEHGSVLMDFGQRNRHLMFKDKLWHIVPFDAAEPVTSGTSFFADRVHTAKLQGTGGIGVSAQGHACVMSRDGQRIALTGPNDDTDVGAVWIFRLDAATDSWVQEDKLVGSDPLAGHQGRSVAFDFDAKTCVVGAPTDDTDIGAVYVWTRNGTTWTEHTKIIPAAPLTTPAFGTSVGVSANGTRIVVGMPGYDTGSGAIGAVAVFDLISDVWTEYSSRLIGSGNTGASGQGTGVAISGDGLTVFMGGVTDNTNVGAVWVFGYNQTTEAWAQSGLKATLFGGSSMSFGGRFIFTNYNGSLMLVSSEGSNAGKGGIALYTRNGLTGQYTTSANATFVGSTTFNSAQRSVCATEDFRTVVVGGAADDTDIGAMWQFSHLNPNSTGANILPIPGNDIEKFLSEDADARGYGASVSCSADGRSVVVTASSIDPSGDGYATVYY